MGQIEMLSPNAVLLPIDMQAAFDAPPWGRSDNPELDANAARLLAAWRRLRMPIVHVRHDSIEPDSTLRPELVGNFFRQGSEPVGEEPIVAKSVNCAFVGTDLDLRLRRLNTVDLVIYGLQLDQCVSTTARIGANLGYRVTLVADATSAFDLPGWNGGTVSAESVRAAHLATLAAEFCSVRTTGQVLAMLEPQGLQAS